MFPLYVFSQVQTVGLFQNDSTSYDGYTLFSPNENTYLIDNCGRLIHTWTSAYKPGNSVYLLEDGTLLRTCRTQSSIFTGGGSGGRIEKIGWDNTMFWAYDFSNNTYHQHHDIHPMDNGNILVLCWEYMSGQEAIDEGRDSSLLLHNELWTTYILEVQPIGTDSIHIVWEWHFKDHLIQDFDSTKNNFGVIYNNPQLLDINFVTGQGKKDWLHCNSINYNSELDEIIISSKTLSEVYIIDHSTTTQEASSHAGGNHNKGGDIIYRWGNPQVYDRGTIFDKTLFGQHDAHWIPNGVPDAGKIMIFNNGQGRGYSSVDIIDPLKDTNNRYLFNSNGTFHPDIAYWSYIDTIIHFFYSSYISGSQRLANGNTLICDGAHGTFFEIDENKNMVWKYINPVLSNSILSQGDPIPTSQNGFSNNTFRCTRFSPGYPGLLGQNLMVGNPIELNPLPINCDINTDILDMNKITRKLIRVVDIVGRDINLSFNRIILYIYSDGSVEKSIRVE